MRNNFFMQNLRAKLPPLNSLVAFEASARHLSFTRAGQELRISREAVSRKIRILENHLGVSLFVRLYRTLELTAAGRELQSVVAGSLEDIARTAAGLRRKTETSKITVTATIAITSFWLTPRLPRFRKKHPDAEIHVNVSDTPLDLLAEGIDVGLQYGDGRWPGLKATKLFDVNSFPVCSPAYLERMGPLDRPRDLRDRTLLYLDGEMHSLENWDWWMGEMGVDMPASARSLRFDSYANVIQAALEGQGVALGFGQVVGDLLSCGQLVRPMEHACSKDLAVYAVVPRGIRPTPNAEQFFNWIIDEARAAEH
ncbi:MAG: LysR substrate-binding domain-containing protein [Alphaproteobacteria bacterium]